MPSFKNWILKSQDSPAQYPGLLGSPALTIRERRALASNWLRTFQVENLPYLRTLDYSHLSPVKNVTLLAYTFPRVREEFLQIEFAIRHTWRLLGRMKTVVIADKEHDDLTKFQNDWPQSLEINYERSLQPGKMRPMSLDCITRLHSRFSTDYCLIIQDDGLPMRNNLADFVGKFDYLGCSTYRNIRPSLQWIIERRKKFILNGGFTLRSRKICQLAAATYEKCRNKIPAASSFHIDDVFYTIYARRFPEYEKALMFPPLSFARQFSVSDLYGAIDIHKLTTMPFGFHDSTTAVQYIPEFRSMGYTIPPLP